MVATATSGTAVVTLPSDTQILITREFNARKHLVYKAWTTHSTADVSMGWIAVLALGTFLWFVYGLILRDAPLIAANGISCALSLVILSLKLRYG